MADIRINALATTAASTASDDFVAVDGSANGTRKLNAFSPTFGGNLTVSGTGTSAINNLSITPTSGHVYLTGPSAAGKFITLQNGNATGGINFRDSAGNEVGSYYQVTDAWTFSKNTTISGNLTVSGTGTSSFGGDVRLPWGSPSLLSYFNATYSLGLAFDSTNRKLVLRAQSADAPANGKGTISFEIGATPSEIARFAPSTGNLLLKSDGIDSANGKLQLATHTTSAGGIGFGTDTTFFRAAAGNLCLGDSGTNAALSLYNAGTQRAYLFAQGSSSTFFIGSLTAGWSTAIQSGNATIALTLDSSQNATFAGNASISQSAGSSPQMTFVRSGTQTQTLKLDSADGLFKLSGADVYLADNVTIAGGKTLQLGSNYTAGAPTATGYVTIKATNGVTYKVLVGT